MQRKLAVLFVLAVVVAFVFSLCSTDGKVEAQSSSSGAISALPALVADPCQNPSAAKQSAFANITTATTTALVPVSGTKQVFVCEVVAQLNSTTASTVLFEQGTGTACAGTPTAKTPTFTNSTIVSEVVDLGSGTGAAFTAAAGNGVCAVTTVGTSPTIPVFINFVQQ